MFAPVAYVQVRLPELSNISCKMTLSVGSGIFVYWGFVMIKAVIFDLDGTLVNSLYDLADSTNYALQVMGYAAHETEKYKYFVGDGMPKLIERALPENARDEKTKAETLKIFMDYYRAHYVDKTCVYDGIIELLHNLSNKGVKLAVVSNKIQEMAVTVTNKLLGEKIGLVCGKQEGYPAKPDPTLTLKVISDLGVTPRECLFVGDSGMDMLVAKNAGCTAVGVTWGFRDREELLNNGADFIVNHPSEILKVVENYAG